jgi:hypothetical protein
MAPRAHLASARLGPTVPIRPVEGSACGTSLRGPANTVPQPTSPTALTFLPNLTKTACRYEQSRPICACCASQVKALRGIPMRRSALFSRSWVYLRVHWLAAMPAHHRCKQAEGWRLEQPEPGRPGLAHSQRPHLRHHTHRIRRLSRRSRGLCRADCPGQVSAISQSSVNLFVPKPRASNSSDAPGGRRPGAARARTAVTFPERSPRNVPAMGGVRFPVRPPQPVRDRS